MSRNALENAKDFSDEEIIHVISHTRNENYSLDELKEFASKIKISNTAPPSLLNKIYNMWKNIKNDCVSESEKQCFMSNTKNVIETEGHRFLRREYNNNEIRKKTVEELRAREEKLTYFEDLVYNKGWRAVPPEQQVLPKKALKDNEFHGYHVINPGNSSKKF